MTSTSVIDPGLRDRIIAFRDDTLRPNIAEWDREPMVAIDALREAATIGLLGMEVPVEQGGLGLSFRGKIEIGRLLSAVSMPFAFSLINTSNVAAKVVMEGTEFHRSAYLDDLLSGERLGSTALTEPGAGSDFGAIATRAERVAGGWVLNGAKAWITNAAMSDVIVTFVQTDPDAGARGIASFFIDGTRSGFVRTEPYRLSGGHVIGTGGFELVDYQASDDDLIAPPGEAFKAAMYSVNGARAYVASMCCAMLRSALGTAVRYGSERMVFGTSVLDHQGLAWSLADVANRLEAAELLAQRAVDAITDDEPRAGVLPAAHAKKFATEITEPGIAACIQAMGAEGLREEHLLGHQLAMARIAHYVDGSTEIQTERIAKSLRDTYA